MDVLVDAVEMAKVLKVPESTVKYYVRKKGMPSIRVGRHLRFIPKKVLKWFEKENH